MKIAYNIYYKNDLQMLKKQLVCIFSVYEAIGVLVSTHSQSH